MEIKLNKEDVKWIKNNYPKLNYNHELKIIIGELNLCREYNNYKIEDFYNLEIKLITKEGSILPQVKELNDKLKKISVNLNLELSDLHINFDETFCLSIYERESEYFINNFTINEFFKNILEPYLYWISFYEKKGYPPWECYAHGNLGYLELYAEGKIDLKELQIKIDKNELLNYKKNKGHCNCLCGSGKKLRNCHQLIYNAIYKLKNEL